MKKIIIDFLEDDGRQSEIEGTVIEEDNDYIVVKVFKKIIFSLRKDKYDLVSFLSETKKVLKKSIKKTARIESAQNFNLATEGWDDGC